MPKVSARAFVYGLLLFSVGLMAVVFMLPSRRTGPLPQLSVTAARRLFPRPPDLSSVSQLHRFASAGGVAVVIYLPRAADRSAVRLSSDSVVAFLRTALPDSASRSVSVQLTGADTTMGWPQVLVAGPGGEQRVYGKRVDSAVAALLPMVR